MNAPHASASAAVPGWRGGPGRGGGSHEPRPDRPQKERREGRDHRDEERAAKPERGDAGRDDDRADDEAGVAADRVEAHARRRPRAGDERDVARALGMEGRHADAADDDGGQRRGIGAGDPGERDPDAADEHAGGHEPGALHPVRGMAEERLDDRRADGERQQERRRAGVGEPAVADQERAGAPAPRPGRDRSTCARRRSRRARAGRPGRRPGGRGHPWPCRATVPNGVRLTAPPLTSRPHCDRNPIHASMPAMKFESFSRFSSSSAAAVSAAVAAPAAHTAGNASATRPTAASSPHTR